MQKISRASPVIAVENVEANVVRLQRKGATAREGDSSDSEGAEALSALMERASNAARQMKYFRLAAKRFSFDELILSAGRAGFALMGEDGQLNEASFYWASGVPDLIFSVSFRDPNRISIVAESQGDIFGLILTGYSQIPTISVEINPTVEDKELGHNALPFRDILLALSGFDDVPAWTKYPEVDVTDAGSLVEMWRDGVCVASVFGGTWNWISARVLTVWDTLRDRSQLLEILPTAMLRGTTPVRAKSHWNLRLVLGLLQRLDRRIEAAWQTYLKSTWRS